MHFARWSRATVLGACVLLGALGAAMAGTPNDQLIVGTSMNNIISLDPAAVSGREATEMVSNVYSHLLELDAKAPAALRPGLAESWTVSDDGTTITLNLRRTATFHSGNPVTAADFVWSMTRSLKLSLNQATTWKSFGFSKENVESAIIAPDAYTVVVRIPEPTDPVLVLNALGITGAALVVDSKLAMQHQKNGDWGSGWLAANDAGSGPFILRVWEANNAVILERFERSWSGRARMARIIFRHMPEPQSLRLAIEKGDLDIAENMAAPDIRAVKDNPRLKVEETPSGNIYYLGVSLKDQRFADKRVRAALRLLIDYDGINKAIMPYYGFLHQRPIQRGALGDLPDPGYRLDVDTAKKLLSEAGYGDGFATTIRVLPDPPYINIATSIQATLAKAGIKARILTGSGDQVYGAMRKRDFEMVVGRGGGGTDPHPHSNLRSQIYNPDNRDEAKLMQFQGWRSSFFDPKLNALIDAALLERDRSKQQTMYEDILRAIDEAVPALLPISQAVDTIVFGADVRNYAYHPSWTTQFWAVYKQR